MDKRELQKLANKYRGRLPRYTSYPTALEFSTDFSRAHWVSLLTQDFAESDEPVSLYLHVPFCHSLCYFCACNKVIARTRAMVQPYIESISRELSFYSELGCGAKKLEQIHWGGGTPNFLTPQEISSVFSLCLDAFPNLSSRADISIELDPRTCTEKHVETIIALGFNRISLGVQDFDPIVQVAINRLQTYEQTLALCKQAREGGIQSINIDLIYGLPNQTREGFSATLEKIAQIRPHRIALFGYAHVTWIKKVQRALERADLPTPEQRSELFFTAREFLQEQGYLHIGLDHFALPEDSLAVSAEAGTLCRNFMGYSAHCGSRVLGIGPSAISSISAAFAQNSRELADYQSLISQHGLAIERGIKRSREDHLRGELIESLLCRGAIDLVAIEKRWELDIFSHFPLLMQALEDYASDGLLTFSEQVISLNPLGKFFVRNIASSFDQYLEKYSVDAKPSFSQSV